MFSSIFVAMSLGQAAIDMFSRQKKASENNLGIFLQDRQLKGAVPAPPGRHGVKTAHEMLMYSRVHCSFATVFALTRIHLKLYNTPLKSDAGFA